MVDPKKHGIRRKLFAHAFSKSSLRTNWENEVREKVSVVVKKIKRDALLGEVDMLRFFIFMTTDTIGHLSFGKSFGTIEKEQVSSSLPILCSIVHFKSRKLNTSKI